MSIGSFLASAGNIGVDIEKYQAESEQRRLLRETAAAQRADLARQESARQRLLNASMLDSAPEYPDLGPPLPVEQVEFAAPEEPMPSPLSNPSARYSSSDPTNAGLKPPRVGVRKFKGVVVPYYDASKPERLRTGVAGFTRIDPNDSDVDQRKKAAANEQLLGRRIGNIIRAGDLLEMRGIGRTFGRVFADPMRTQSDKAAMLDRERALDWYDGSKRQNSRDYFRRNPEMLAVAEKDPVGFYKTVVSRPAGVKPKGSANTPVANTPVGAKPASSRGSGGSPTQGLAFTDPLRGAGRGSPKPGQQFGAKRDQGRRRHNGVDISASIGTPVFSGAGPGRVVAVKDIDGGRGGKHVFLDHGRGVITKYMHLNTVNVKRNDWVTDATQIGTTGNTGTSTGPHLHYEIMASGQNVNPENTAELVARTTPVVPGATPGSAPIPVRKDISSFYLRDPKMVSRDTRAALTQRMELVRLAEIYRDSGMASEYTAARLKIHEVDNGLSLLAGMQGIYELAFANDPRRLSAVMSDAAGVPIVFQPRNDGTWNTVVNGQVVNRGVTTNDVIDTARSAFDATYAASQSKAQSEMAMEFFKSRLKMSEKASEIALTQVKEIEMALLNGRIAEAKDIAAAMNPNGKLTILPDQSGRAYLQLQGQTLLINPGGELIEGGRPGLLTAPSAVPIGGTQRSVGPGSGG